MTNEQWLKSLPTETFAKFLTCKACQRKYHDTELDNCFAPNCTDEQIRWLKTERTLK